MALLTWLRGLLHRPAPTLAPPATPAPARRGPLVPVPAPTPAQWANQTASRQPAIADLVAQARQHEELRHLPDEVLRLDVGLRYLRWDLEMARGMCWDADELRLLLEVSQAEGRLRYLVWQQSLSNLFGPELGEKLARHEVEVGMSSAHLFTSYGTPPAGSVTCRAQQPTRWAVQYGSPATGSYFELEGNEVTLALRGVPSFPAGLFD